jgi:hypothetical protein
MCSLPSESEVPIFAVEVGAVLYQFDDVARAFFNEDADGFGIAKPRAGFDRVLKVQPQVVVVAQYDSYAPLRVFCIRFGYHIFSEHQDAT